VNTKEKSSRVQNKVCNMDKFVGRSLFSFGTYD
jgi:hypothetical protein